MNTGGQESIPEPFWVRTWRTLYRWRPACYQCQRVFSATEAHDQHWLGTHSQQAQRNKA